MISISQIKAKIHKWKRRHEFNKLSPTWQKIIRFSGKDPDTLEAKEREAGDEQ